MNVYKDQLGSLNSIFELTQTSCSCFGQQEPGGRKRASQTQSNLMLGSQPKSFFFFCPCSGKAFLIWRNKTIQPTNQPTNRPASHSLLSAAVHLDAAHAGEPRYPSLGKTEDPNKKLLTEVWGVHAGNGEQLDPRRTYQPGSGRKEICTCGPVVPLHTTPYLMNRYRAGWLLAQKEDQQTVRTSRFQMGSSTHPKPRSQKNLP